MFLNSLRTRRGASISASTVTLAAIGLGVFAFADDGVATADVELHDGGIWLTNQSTLMVGHLNFSSQVLDSAVRTTASQFDVLQEGTTVLVHDTVGNSVSVIDPAYVAAAAEVALPADALVALGKGTVAIAEPEEGLVWVMPVAWLGTFDKDNTPPAATLGAGVSVTVGSDGTAFALSADTGASAVITLDDEGAATVSESAAIDGLTPEGVDIAAVGSGLAVWDPKATTLHMPGGKTFEFPAGSELQQSSEAHGGVAVATPTELVFVPSDGSTPQRTVVGPQGTPAAPVYLNGCTYAAWAGSGVYVRDCADDAFDTSIKIDGALPSAAFIFRVNRDLVVLNDYMNGSAWLATEGLESVTNWDDLLPPPVENRTDEVFDEEEEVDTLPPRDEANTPPVAEDDTFGARAGRTTVLPIIDNDFDRDGDVLTALPVDVTDMAGEVQTIRGGAALQVVLSPTASGLMTFTYRVSDGRQGFDDATVTVDVSGPDSNEAPFSRRNSRLSLEAGAVASYNVLPDWIDPEGDTIFLRAVEDNGVDIVDFSPDGMLTITANPDVQGTRAVEFVISDGRVDVTGSLRLDVWPTGTQVPLTNADHVVTGVDTPVTVTPLGNDMSRSGLPLRLSGVEEVLDATVIQNPENNSFTFSASAAGTYYVPYQVTDGPSTSNNLVRVDVTAALESSQAPIAVADVALVTPGGETLVDVLANDVDPTRGVLVVQGVDVPLGSGLEVSILEHRLVRVRNLAGITEPVTLNYRVSNGALSTQSEITVLPIEPPKRVLAPIAGDDEVVVRAGDIATVDVVDNDYHPSGLTFDLVGLGEPAVDPAFADVFISAGMVRVKAGQTAGDVAATYDIVDEFGQRDSAVIKIRVVGADEENVAPRPQDVTGRSLSGGAVRIPIPLEGIDPDGDSVTLIGVGDSPELGRVTQVGQDWLVYEAYSEGLGTDHFTYVVRDRLGAEATGNIIVGVAASEFLNHAPDAVKDDVAVRPGRTVSYPVLVNDSDIDSDLLSLVPDSLEVPEGITAKISADRVVVTAADEGWFTIRYTVQDVYGATASGALVVTVDPDTAAIPPIARDDRVLAADVAEDGSVVVDVLGNDEDPDGVVSALVVAVDPLEGVVNPDGTVTVLAQEASRIITYSVTDEDAQAASAFILVPGVGDRPPALRDGAAIEVVSGAAREIPLADFVATWNGNPAILTEVERVFAANADSNPRVIDETTLTYTSKEGYVGKDAITFQVTDGLTLDDPEGALATITIPITVLPAGNEPPTFRNTSAEVWAGGEPVTVDLTKLSTDPNPEDVETLSWSVVDTPRKGLKAVVADGILTITAADDLAGGTVEDIALAVSDGAGEPVDGIVRVTVMKKSGTGASGEEGEADDVVVDPEEEVRELPIANDDAAPDAQAGKPSVVDVLTNDFNPYAPEPLTITGTVVESGQGAATIDGDKVTVTPAADFAGTMVVRYTIADATNDPARQASARILVTVVKAPDAPTKPVLKSVEDRTVVLEWVEPPNNGSPIELFTVTDDKGTATTCLSSICTIGNLTNAVEYRFTVTATNGAGVSKPSPMSDVARPDVHPDQPKAPSLKFGDRSLAVSWTPATTKGSPIRSYTLELSPAPPSGAQKTNLTGTSFVWTGLENGIAYQARIRAYNDAVEPSSWSDYSASEIPAGPPLQVAKPTTTRLAPVGSRAQIAVTWAIPSGNGDPVSGFTVSALRGGTLVSSQQVSGTTKSAPFQLDPSSSNYTFTVVARNKAGSSVASAPSDPRRAFIAPGAPTGVAAAASDKAITVTFTRGPANGADAAWITHEYELNGNGTWRALPADGRIGGLQNGTAYTVKVRATTTADGATYVGPPSAASAAATPFGQIGNPTVTARSGSGQVVFDITAPATNGRPITRIDYSTDGTNWANAGFTSGTKTIAVGAEPGVWRGMYVRVYAQDTPNPGTASASASAYPRRSWVSKGDKKPGYANSPYLVINWSEFQTGTYKVTCRDNYPPTDYISTQLHTVNVNASSGSQQLLCFFGYPGYNVFIHWESGPGAPFDSEVYTW